MEYCIISVTPIVVFTFFSTVYLTEREKEADRKDARKTLKILEKTNE